MRRNSVVSHAHRLSLVLRCPCFFKHVCPLRPKTKTSFFAVVKSRTSARSNSELPLLTAPTDQIRYSGMYIRCSMSVTCFMAYTALGLRDCISQKHSLPIYNYIYKNKNIFEKMSGYVGCLPPPTYFLNTLLGSLQSNLQREDTLGAGVLSFVQRLSLSRSFTHISIKSLFNVKIKLHFDHCMHLR